MRSELRCRSRSISLRRFHVIALDGAFARWASIIAVRRPGRSVAECPLRASASTQARVRQHGCEQRWAVICHNYITFATEARLHGRCRRVAEEENTDHPSLLSSSSIGSSFPQRIGTARNRSIGGLRQTSMH